MNSRRAHHGVTLVELAIGIAVMAVLLALAAPSFKNWIQSSQIRTAAESIQNGLQLARAEAVRRNANVQFVLSAGSSWTVGCKTPVADLDGDGVPDCPGTGTTPSNIQARTGSEGSSNASVDVTPTVVFNGLGRTTPAVTIAITNPTGGACATLGGGGPMRCLNVVVTTGGQIRMCDPARASADPQGC